MIRASRIAGSALAIGLVIGSLGMASAKAPTIVRHTGSGSVVPGAKLKGYTIVDSGSFNVPASSEVQKQTSCPTGTKPLGGGPVVASGEVGASIHASYPISTGWVVVVNNNTASSTTFAIEVVCAKKPAGWKIVTASASNTAGSQKQVIATCPAATKVLGGGGSSSGHSLLVNLNSMIPSGTREWVVDTNNASASTTTAHAYAVCGKNVTGWQIVEGGVVTNPAGTQTNAVANCPAGTKVTGGGVGSSSSATSVNMNTSYPASATQWSDYENNASASSETMAAYAVCATV
jgi:hypothetical protein